MDESYWDFTTTAAKKKANYQRSRFSRADKRRRSSPEMDVQACLCSVCFSLLHLADPKKEKLEKERSSTSSLPSGPAGAPGLRPAALLGPLASDQQQRPCWGARCDTRLTDCFSSCDAKTGPAERGLAWGRSRILKGKHQFHQQTGQSAFTVSTGFHQRKEEEDGKTVSRLFQKSAGQLICSGKRFFCLDFRKGKLACNKTANEVCV